LIHSNQSLPFPPLGKEESKDAGGGRKRKEKDGDDGRGGYGDGRGAKIPWSPPSFPALPLGRRSYLGAVVAMALTDQANLIRARSVFFLHSFFAKRAGKEKKWRRAILFFLPSNQDGIEKNLQRN
jgi:hypothetical protein